MKKLILLFAVMFTLYSCSEDEVTYSEATFVSFQNTNAEININEDVGTRNLTIGIASAQSEDVTVQIETNDLTATQGEHYNIPSSVVIPAGEQFVDLPIEVIDDEDINSTRSFEIEIVSTSTDVEVGIVDEGSYAKTIRIINDDCPTQYGYWIGDVTIEDVGFGTSPGSAGANELGDCDLLVVEGDLAGIGIAAIYELQFFPAVPDGSLGQVVVQETLVLEEADADGLYDAVYQAAGTFNVNTGEIELDYTVYARSRSTGEIVGTFYEGQNIITVNE